MDKFGLLHHVEIYVSNLKASSNFWDWFFPFMGYKKYQEWSEGVSWKSGNTYIVLVQTQTKYLENKYNRCNVGLNHLAFWGKSKSHVDEIYMMVKEKGYNVLYEDKYPLAGGEDYYALYFEEPLDRMKIEIVAP